METILNLNMFDTIVIGLIVLLSIKGLISGFTKELFSAVSIIGGLYLATLFKKDLAEYINTNFINGVNIKILELISLIAIFIIFWFIVHMIYKLIESFSKDDYISATSRLAGMLIKMLTLFFIFSLIIYGLSSKPQVTDKFKDVLENSKIYPLLKSSGATILNAKNMINSSVLENNETKESNNTENLKQDSNNSIIIKDENSTKDINKTALTIFENNNSDNNISK